VRADLHSEVCSVITDGGHQEGRHHHVPVADQSRTRKKVGWRRAVAAAACLGLAGVAVVALSSSAGAKVPLAKADLLNVAGEQIGRVVFKGVGTYASRVEVEINAATVPGLGSYHGIHVHTRGVCDPLGSFTSAGGHLNPDGVAHGAHKGDLPSVLLTAEGEGYVEFETDRIDVNMLLDEAVDGSAVVLHTGPDNFANIPTAYGPLLPSTLNTGDAGSRYACGVIEKVE
jgi:superoxide dismutase, Cu-Zn family